MKYRKKFLYFAILISMLSNTGFAVDIKEKAKSELIVSGKNMLERIEDKIEIEKKEYGLDMGYTPIQIAVWADDYSTVHNIGSVVSGEQQYTTQFGSVLGIGGKNNKLEKTDNLLVLKNNVTLNNDGLINMGATNHLIQNIVEVLDLAFYRKFADYYKNVINSENSNIYNSGIIKSSGDKFFFDTYVKVALLKYNNTYYNKNIINMNRGEIENKGVIEYDRDEKAKLLKALAVDLIGLGIHYNRTKNGILSNNGTIINEKNGKINILGDLYTSEKYSGIDVKALGAGLVGVHEKYGINATNSHIINKGIINIERDFKFGKEEHGNGILDLVLILPTDFLKLGLLSIDNTTETSIGVSLKGGTFENDGGTLHIESNKPGTNVTISHMKSVGVEATDNAKITFKGDSKVELEGTHIYVGDLKNGSTMTFEGNTDIFYQTAIKDKNNVLQYQGNTNIFSNDKESKYIIKGKINIDGKTSIVGADTPHPVGNDPFIADLTITKDNNIYLDVDTIPLKTDESQPSTEEKNKTKSEFGKITASGKITLDSQLKISGETINSNWDKFEADGEYGIKINNIVLVGKQGIDGKYKDVPIIIENPMYSIDLSTHGSSANKETSISIDSIKRNPMRFLLRNITLATILDDSFYNPTPEQKEIHKDLASAKNKDEFDEKISEITGRDTVTTLNSQVYDITKDLNKQFVTFAKNNENNGVIFKYINSKSKLDSNSSTKGFERKSWGIITGYNKNISEKLRLGTGFSYMKSDIDYTSAGKNSIETWNINGYSDYKLKYASLFNEVSLGYNKLKNTRLSAQENNTGVKKGDANIYSLSLNNSLYKDFDINNKFSLTTSLNLDLTYLYQDKYKESGDMTVSMDSANSFFLTPDVSIDGKYNFLSLGDNKFYLLSGVDYSYDVISDVKKSKIKMKAFEDKGYYHEETRKLDRKSLTYNIGLKYEYNQNYSVGIKYTRELINDINNNQIGVDFTYKF